MAIKKINYSGNSKVIKRLCEVVNGLIDGGGGGSTVSYSQTLSSGTETGEITIDGVATKMYAPTPPTKVSELQNDTGFITSTVSNLINYYTKTETYTKAEVDAAIAAVSTLNLLVVQTLPTQDISTTTIYLVPKQTAGTQNVYDEYIYIMSGGVGSWELIGDTEVDLSNYYTKTQVDNLIPTDFVSKANGGTFESDITIDNRYGGFFGNSVLTLGNDLPYEEHGNSRGHIKLYGGLQGFTTITPADSTQRRDIDLPDKNGTIALLDDLTTFVSDNPTFNEAQTRANIASGESFATILGKIKKWFTDIPSMFVSKSGDTMSGNLTVDRRNGTASAAGESYIQIGNNTAEGSVGNSYGELYLYSKSTKYVGLGARNLTGDRMIDLPDKSGTVAVYSEYTLEGTTTASGALLIPNALRTYNFIALQYANSSAVTVGFIFRREYSYLTCLTNSLTPVSETTVKVKIIYI